MHCECTRQGGILYILSPKLSWLWYIFWCQCSVEHALGNVHLTAISQNVKIQQDLGCMRKAVFLRDQHSFTSTGRHCQGGSLSPGELVLAGPPSHRHCPAPLFGPTGFLKVLHFIFFTTALMLVGTLE